MNPDLPASNNGGYKIPPLGYGVPPLDKRETKIPPPQQKEVIPREVIKQVSLKVLKLTRDFKLSVGDFKVLLFLRSKGNTVSYEEFNRDFKTVSQAIKISILTDLEKKGFIEIQGATGEKVQKLDQIKEIKLTQRGVDFLSGKL